MGMTMNGNNSKMKNEKIIDPKCSCSIITNKGCKIVVKTIKA
jgi:hypothetical protein